MLMGSLRRVRSEETSVHIVRLGQRGMRWDAVVAEELLCDAEARRCGAALGRCHAEGNQALRAAPLHKQCYVPLCMVTHRVTRQATPKQQWQAEAANQRVRQRNGTMILSGELDRSALAATGFCMYLATVLVALRRKRLWHTKAEQLHQAGACRRVASKQRLVLHCRWQQGVRFSPFSLMSAPLQQLECRRQSRFCPCSSLQPNMAHKGSLQPTLYYKRHH
jgi:hypothetical protein